MNSCGLAVVLTAVVAIVTPLTGQTSAKKTTVNPDTWERSKECAAKAEKVMADKKENDQRARDTDPTDVRDHQWISHYSPKYDKCFLRDSRTHFEDKYLVSTIELMDAFERRVLASRRAIGDKVLCRIGSDVVDCDSWTQFILVRITN